ncbi:hypothetical protein DL93DRAFT_2054764 [Clavulina sp. PMI_390]|nr:hypothetical protein DL93DRAFT_2054764 [Clavulina sp. PMI_390]
MSSDTADSFTFTVGKLDAGMAILIGERAHLIEFPSILLPPGVSSGSIVNIAVHRNLSEEKRQRQAFWDLQNDIFSSFGVDMPKAPKLEVRNVTQTSITLQWPALELATSKLRSLEIYRNGERLAAIPNPIQNTSTKVSGLDVQTKYTFHLVLRTTAGTFNSNTIDVKTHAMSDTSGISVCFGNVQDPVLLEQAKLALEEMKAKWSDRIQIDTTHFVCTTPAPTPSGATVAGNASVGAGVEYQKALQLSIPVVQPQWVLACLQEKKMVPIASFYLGATPNAAISAAAFSRPRPQSQPPSRQNSSSTTSLPSNRNPTSTPPVSQTAHPLPPTLPEEDNEDDDEMEEPRARQRPVSLGAQRSRRTGTMDRAFKFPPPPVSPIPDITINGLPAPKSPTSPEARTTNIPDEAIRPVELPPPTPAKNEVQQSGDVSDGEDVGETEEVDLS